MAKTYKDNLYTLRDLRQAKDTKAMAREVQRMAAQLNQRFYRLEKKDLESSSYAYQVAQRETGKEKPRYTESISKLENMPLTELYQLGLDIDVKLYSQTTTIRGLRKIENERLQHSYDSLIALVEKAGFDTKDINYDDYKKFLKDGGGELLNSKYTDSEDIREAFVEYTQSGNVTVKEFIREFKRYKSLANVDYGKLRRNLNRIQKKRQSK